MAMVVMVMVLGAQVSNQRNNNVG